MDTYTPGLDPAFPLTWYSHAADDPKPAEVQSFVKDLTEEEGYTPWVGACVEACLGNCAPPISNADSLRSVVVCHAIYESHATEKMVAV